MTTFTDREQSLDDSEPVELYRFYRTVGTSLDEWLYANCESHVIFDGKTYSATPGLTRGPISATGEASTMQVEIEAPRLACVTDEMALTSTPTPIKLTITRWQRGLAFSEAAVLFNGEISASTFEGGTVRIVGNSAESAWGDQLTRLYCQRNCPHMLFDEFCGANKEVVTFGATVVAISADLLTITVAETDPSDRLDPDSTFYLTGTVNAAGRIVFVVKQVGPDLTVQTPLRNLAVDDEIFLVAGCNRQVTDCKNVHNNIERFGGFHMMPERSPWTTLR